MLKKRTDERGCAFADGRGGEKCYLRPAADTDGWQALQPFGQTEVLVSVIVPVHNGEKDLKQCLNSILAQECGSTVEIIAVNDNSTDSSGDILEEYANWGEVRRVELTKETGGSAAKARNAGILQAKGEYLLFVDCDDVLLPGAISALLQKAQQTGADIVQGGWQYLDGDGKFGAAQRFAEHIYEKRTAYDCLDLPGTPWAKLYRRSLFDEIRFPAGYTCFEDAVIHFLIFRRQKRSLPFRRWSMHGEEMQTELRLPRRERKRRCRHTGSWKSCWSSTEGSSSRGTNCFIEI